MDHQKEALASFCNQVLQLGHDKWNANVFEPLHRNTANFARVYLANPDERDLQEAADQLESTVMICVSTDHATEPEAERLLNQLHILVDDRSS
jgi:hypothetical protein